MPQVTPPADVLAGLLDPATAEAAAAELAATPSWLAAAPPPEVLAALRDPRLSHDGAVVALARAWRPAALLPALVAALPDEPDPDRRRRLAWTLKQTADRDVVPALLPHVLAPAEDRIVRRYLIEALARATSAADVWPAVSPAVRTLAADPDPLIREAAAAWAAAGEDHDAERRDLLLALLDDPDDTVVAVTAAVLARYAPLDLPDPLKTHLLHHHDPRVRDAVQELWR
jgi:hypothetical protein